jgi:hypothetical protein
LFGAMSDGVCLAALALCPAVPLPIELPVAAPLTDIGLVTLPTATGLVTTEVDVAAPPITAAGFEAPPIALCFVLAGPPSAFWARVGRARPTASMPIDITSTVVLIMALFFFMGAIFLSRISVSIPYPRCASSDQFTRRYANVNAQRVQSVPRL